MNDMTFLILAGIVIILALLGLAYFIWPTDEKPDVPRYTTSSKNGRGYWE